MGEGIAMTGRIKLFYFIIFISSFFAFGIHFINSSPSLAQSFTIQRFHSDILIREDATVIVQEDIVVEFHQSRHGIYREIPFKYRDDFGKVITTPIKILSVKDDSEKPWNYQVEKRGSVIHLRIGDPKRYVKGKQTYRIAYQVKNVILFFDDHDELYWNVTGLDWKAPILEASAKVYLDTKEKSKTLMVKGYEGGLGSREECDYESYDQSGKFSAKRSLRAGEGLTIVFGWDKGIVHPPSTIEKTLWTVNLEENWVFFLPFLSFFYMMNRWFRRGRDPKVRESVMVLYKPPQINHKPLLPAEIGVLIDEKMDPRDMTSTAVDLAIKGYIRIEEVKKEGWLFDSVDYYLKKLKEPDQHLSPFETELMKALFPGKLPGILVSELRNRFYTHLPALKELLMEELVKKGFFPKSPEKVRNSYMGAGIFVMVLIPFVLVILLSSPVTKGVLAGLGSGLPLLLFARFMPAKTRTGSLAYMESLGFQEFLNRAEKDRIERMGEKDLFSKFLPYAIALDVVENWSKAFEGIYQNPPNWYVSSAGGRTFTPYAFTHSIRSVTSNLSSAMFSSPRGSGGGRSGFGGGGSSGGGFGGGGGGSW